jgi:hypothetical protein
MVNRGRALNNREQYQGALVHPVIMPTATRPRASNCTRSLTVESAAVEGSTLAPAIIPVAI